ncbi:hypothetical protein AGMMS49525_13430 [Bacteroidia bacterium]|nr:hypothetical protein AGMMS49525_13430 [Bacteroidia bacterium]
MITKKLVFVAMVAIVLGMSACSSKKEVGTSATRVGASTQPVIATQNLTGKQWLLVELNGKPITPPANAAITAFLKFNPDGTVSGNAGCNAVNGSYSLKEGNRIHFEKMVTTMKMCLDMETETNMLKVLEIADNYNVTASTLILNRARMAPLAKFEAQ